MKEGKSCPIRSTIAFVKRSKGSTTKGSIVESETMMIEGFELYNETFDENVEETFSDCLSCAFSQSPTLFDSQNQIEMNYEAQEDTETVETSEIDSELLRDAMDECDKICTECAIMNGKETNASEDTLEKVKIEYPLVHSTVVQFEDLAKQLEPNCPHKHEKSLTATLLGKVAHLQLKKSMAKTKRLSKVVMPDRLTIEEWLYYASIAKIPYSLTEADLTAKLKRPEYININMLDYSLEDDFTKQTLAYTMVEDTFRKELLIAFRGTSDFATALYDAEFRPHKLKIDGEVVWVHTGMWAVAKKLWKKLSPFLIEHRDEYKFLTVCGHSLGAGVAALFAFICNHYKPQEEIGEISCFGIATPAVISSNNLNHHKRIVSLVLGDDIVPRLSFASVVALFSLASSIFETVPGIKNLLSGKKSKESQETLEKLVSMASTVKNESVGSQLLPAGKIFHLSENMKIGHILEVAPEYFGKFVMSPRGWKHHRLDLYRLYLASILSEGNLSSIFH